MGYIETQITDAISSGQLLVLGNDLAKAIVADPKSQGKDIIALEVLVGTTINSFSKLVGIFGGKSVTALVPKDSLKLDGVTITIKSIGFVFSKKSNEIIQLNAKIGFTGAKLPLPTPGTSDINLILDSIDFVWSSPGKDMELFMANVNGKVTTGSTADKDKLTLEASMTFPGEVITLDQAKGQTLNMGKFFSGLGLPDIGILDKVSLSHLDLSIDPVAKSFDMSGVLAPTSGTSLTLVKDLLSLEKMCFGLSYITKGKSNGYINGSLLFMNYLALDIRAKIKPSLWDFSGNINIPGTCTNLGIPPNAKGDYAVPLGTLITKLFPGIAGYIPSSLNDLSISILLIDYSYAKKGGASNSTYKFQGGQDGQWTLGSDDIKADVEVTLTNTSKAVSADFTMDGFDFNLKCDFGTSKTISASISAMIDGSELNGTYLSFLG